MKLGEFLRQSRMEAGLTQEGMADKVGVSTTSVQNWEKNTFPDPQYWPLISDALSVKATDIAVHIAETVVPPKEEKSRKTCSFPEFLFPEKHLSRIKALRFTDWNLCIAVATIALCLATQTSPLYHTNIFD